MSQIDSEVQVTTTFVGSPSRASNVFLVLLFTVVTIAAWGLARTSARAEAVEVPAALQIGR